MKSYILPIIHKDKVAEDTLAFKLRKPEDFTFIPGQYQQVFLSADPNDSHTFSIASAPYEDFLMFATRIRDTSVFKQRLAGLKEGEEIRIEAPSGQFTLPKEQELPIVFLVGGIGITPVRSMIKQAEKDNASRAMTLFYSNRRPEDAAFLHELENVSLPHYRLIVTMTDMANSSQEWNGETGYIDRTLLDKYINDLSSPVYFVVGPPGFVEAMVNLLHSIDEVPSTHVKSEDFAGY